MLFTEELKSFGREYRMFVAMLCVTAFFYGGFTRNKARCERLEAESKAELHSLREELTSMKNQYIADLKKREAEVRSLQKTNAQLARDIDKMTATLRQWAPDAFKGTPTF